jgi:hypothetical protein
MGAGTPTGKALRRVSALETGGESEGPPNEKIGGRRKTPAQKARARVAFMFASVPLLIGDSSWH